MEDATTYEESQPVSPPVSGVCVCVYVCVCVRVREWNNAPSNFDCLFSLADDTELLERPPYLTLTMGPIVTAL